MINGYAYIVAKWVILTVFTSRGSSNRPAREWMTHKSLYKMKTAVHICS